MERYGVGLATRAPLAVLHPLGTARTRWVPFQHTSMGRGLLMAETNWVGGGHTQVTGTIKQSSNTGARANNTLDK